jgi:hypothetical protein
MDICEKIAYIKGLAEGLGLDETTKEGKVLNAIIDLLGDITEEICDIEDGCDELMEQIDAVDEDLASLEDFIYEDDDCDCDCDCDCDEFDDEDPFYEVTCGACQKTICVSEDVLLEGEIECPNCGEILEFDFTGLFEDEECECGCGCCDHDHSDEDLMS